MEEAVKLHDSLNTDKEKPSNVAVDKYAAFQSRLFEVLYEHNTFIDFINICVSCMASEKEHKMTKHLNNMCRKTIDLLHDLGKFCR